MSLVSTTQDEVVQVQVTATTGVAAAWGIHHYLKYGCNVHVSWDVSQLGKDHRKNWDYFFQDFPTKNNTKRSFLVLTTWKIEMSKSSKMVDD